MTLMRIHGCGLGKNTCIGDCQKCSFYKKNEERLNAYLRENGLTKCDDGLYRLIVPKDWKEPKE